MGIQLFEIIPLIGWVIIGICSLAVLYAIAAALTPIRTTLWRHRRSAAVPVDTSLGISVLKPLCGDEPRLYENLATFCEQTHHTFQLICGVSSSNDHAINVVHRLQCAFQEIDIVLIVDDRMHGVNRKVGNLINMAPFVRHPWVVVADSDIAVKPDYLQKVTAPLLDPKVGVVTCLYRGVGVSGLWSRMGALFINQWFAPSVLLAHAGGSTRFGFGATLALRMTTLVRIGGFMRLKDCLADDYWLAAHARQLGLKTILSSEVVATDVIETDPKALWSRELRWLRTIRSLNPLGFAFLFITFTSPWLMIGGLLSYALHLDAATDTAIDAVMDAATDLASDINVQVANEAALLARVDIASCIAAVTLSGCVARLFLHGRSAYHAGGFWRDLALLPIRDSVLLLQWVAACFGTRVAWRGASIAIVDVRSRLNSVPHPQPPCVSETTSKPNSSGKPKPSPSSLTAERPSTVHRKQYD